MRVLGLILVGLVGCAGCASKVYPGDGSPIAIMIVDDAGLQRDEPVDVAAGIARAIAIWNDATRTRFQLGGKSNALTVHIGGEYNGCGAEVVQGCYTWTGEIWVQAAVQSGGGGLDVTLAHELGHAIGLPHVARGIMAPVGDGSTSLQADDLAAYRALWGD